MPLTARQAAALVIDKWRFTYPAPANTPAGDYKKGEWIDDVVETMRTALMHAYSAEVKPEAIKREVETLWTLLGNNIKMLEAMTAACDGVYTKDGEAEARACASGIVGPAATFIDYRNFRNWSCASSPLRRWTFAYLVDLFQRLDDLGTNTKFLQTCAAEPIADSDDEPSSEEGEGESEEEEESSEDEESADSEEAESDAEAAEAAEAADERGGGKRRRG